jgi:hypothetical protein
MFALLAALALLRLLATTPAAIPHAVLIALAFGALASFLANIAKQDHFPTWLNTVVAWIVIAGSAGVVAAQSVTAFTWHLYFSTFWPAAVGAIITHFGLLEPTGIGPKIQTLTTIGDYVLTRRPVSTPVDSPPPPTPPAARRRAGR